MKGFFLAILCLANTLLPAQDKSQRFGIKVEGGASIVATNYDEMVSSDPLIGPVVVEFWDQWAPSYNFGLVYSNQFSRRSEISAEIKFSQIQSTMVYYYPDNYESKEFKTGIRISYLSIPIYYGFKISKFTPSLGFRFSRLISDRYINYKSSVNGETHDVIGTDKMDYGPQIGLTFNLSEKLTIESFFYYGLNNLVNWENPPYIEPEPKMEVRQITLGVRYTFLELLSN